MSVPLSTMSVCCNLSRERSDDSNAPSHTGCRDVDGRSTTQSLSLQLGKCEVSFPNARAQLPPLGRAAVLPHQGLVAISVGIP